MKTLITGATGSVGRSLVQRLTSQGVAVHALARHPSPTPLPAGVQEFLGDITSEAVPSGVFDDVTSMFLFPAQGNLDSFLKQARLAGVRRVVVLSSLSAALHFPRDHRSISAKHHLIVERSVLDSGLDFTLLRPGSFAGNLRQWAPTIRQNGMVFGPYPDSSQALIHEADIADAAASILMSEGHSKAVYELTGPCSLTQREQLNVLARAIGRPLTFQTITLDQFRQSLERFVSPEIVQMILDYWEDTNIVPDTVTDTVAQLTQKPARSLDQWASDHASEFR